MLALQLAIGAANDWADAPADARARPAKPIPAGLVARRTAAAIAVLLAATGLAMAGVAGAAALGVAIAGLAAGLAYDLRLKGTRWSWLPYALGLPLLPVFGWVGSTGSLPLAFAVLVPVAMGAGTALALANALADLERDAVAGVTTVATSMGPAEVRRLGAALQALVVVGALGSAAALGGSGPWIGAGAVAAGVVAAGVTLGWRSDRTARQRAWEVQAVGLGVLAAAWVGSLAAAGRLGG
jgi:4-hydroxybenzoate polyprenyltransferase